MAVYVEGLGAGRNGTIDIAADEIVRFGFFKNAGASENDAATVSRMNPLSTSVVIVSESTSSRRMC